MKLIIKFILAILALNFILCAFPNIPTSIRGGPRCMVDTGSEELEAETCNLNPSQQRFVILPRTDKGNDVYQIKSNSNNRKEYYVQHQLNNSKLLLVKQDMRKFIEERTLFKINANPRGGYVIKAVSDDNCLSQRGDSLSFFLRSCDDDYNRVVPFLFNFDQFIEYENKLRDEKLEAERAIAQVEANKYFKKVVEFLPSVKVPILSTWGNSCVVISNSQPQKNTCSEMETGQEKLFQFISKGDNVYQIRGYDGGYLQSNSNRLEYVNSSSLSSNQSLWTLKITSDKKFIIKSQTENMCLDTNAGATYGTIWAYRSCDNGIYQTHRFPQIDEAIRKAEKAQAEKLRQEKLNAETAIAQVEANKYLKKVVEFLPTVKVPILSTWGNSCVVISNSQPQKNTCSEMETGQEKLFQFISKGDNVYQIRGYDGGYLQSNSNRLEYVNSSSLSSNQSLWTLKITSDKKFIIKSQTENMCLDTNAGATYGTIWAYRSCDNGIYQTHRFPQIDEAIRKAEKAQAEKPIQHTKPTKPIKPTKPSNPTKPTNVKDDKNNQRLGNCKPVGLNAILNKARKLKK